MDAYKFVDKVYVMTAGGPAQRSELPVFIAFQKGIREFQVGESESKLPRRTLKIEIFPVKGSLSVLKISAVGEPASLVSISAGSPPTVVAG